MTAQQERMALQWTRQIDLLCPSHQEVVDAARAFSIPELDNDAIGFVIQQLFHDLFRLLGKPVSPEEFAPMLESLTQCFVSTAVQRGVAHRIQLRMLAGDAEFQISGVRKAEREAARLCVVAGGFAAAARCAIGGMIQNCQPVAMETAVTPLQATADWR